MLREDLHRDFITCDAGEQRFITTARLMEHVSRWEIRLIEKAKDSPEYVTQTLTANYSHLQLVCVVVQNMLGYKANTDIIDSKISLSIIALLSTLSRIYMSLAYDVNVELPPLDFDHSSLVFRRVEEISLCLNYTTFLDVTLTPESLYLFTSIQWTKYTRDHSDCSNEICNRNQIRESDYESQHIIFGTNTLHDCSCGFLTPSQDKEEIINIIAEGDIRLLQINAIADRVITLEVKIVRAQPSSEYVTISHMWSDGLGNVSSNSLPFCQL